MMDESFFSLYCMYCMHVVCGVAVYLWSVCVCVCVSVCVSPSLPMHVFLALCKLRTGRPGGAHR